MKKLILIISLALLAASLKAQTDSIPAFLRESGMLHSEAITKARRYLLDKFIARDMEAVKQTKDYMMAYLDNEDYLALYPVEYIMLSYWTHDYDELLLILPVLDTLSEPGHRRRVLPEKDFLYEKIYEKSIDSYSALVFALRAADLGDEEKAFLLLFFDYMMMEDEFPQVTQEMLNDAGEQFLATYPGSRYEGVVRRYVILRLVPAKTGSFMEFYGGMGFFTRGLSTGFNDFGLFGMGYSLRIHSTLLNFGLLLGPTTNLIATDYKGTTWDAGERASLVSFETSLGYQLWKNHRFTLAPLAGVGFIEIAPSGYDEKTEPEMKDLGLKLRGSLLLGAHLDYNFSRRQSVQYSYLGIRQVENIWLVRLGYNFYSPGFGKKYDGYDGAVHIVRLGIGYNSHRLVRDW
jgi:hypothetical protein